jgi:aminoglycoside phosphotransferase family enzyme/predicted kinase
MSALDMKSPQSLAETRQRVLIVSLRDPRRYPDQASQVEHLETHISHILLAGGFAYKIKKPVSLGFLDFSDLNARRFYCEEELRLNRRTAPGLYLQVIPICGTEEKPIFNGEGAAIEYALKMRRFSQRSLFSKLLDRGELTSEHIESLAANIASFHGNIEKARDADAFGTSRLIERQSRQNFTQLASLLPGRAEELKELRHYVECAHANLTNTFNERKRLGFVRECHGDLHLDNITFFDGDVALFDCVEFNADLRCIDVMSDLAFTIMDLCFRGRHDFASQLLNSYLEHTGDYAGVVVLRYYIVYRALVRAKIEALRDSEQEIIGAYLRLARRFAFAANPAILITHGVSGSGKSTLTKKLLEDLGAIRVRSDLERKRLFDFARDAATVSPLAQGLYSPEASDKTYERLEEVARTIVDAGFPVIVDAANLKRRQRQRFEKLATTQNAPFVVLSCRASAGELRVRINERRDRGGDPSEADEAVLEHQLATQDSLTSDELATTVLFDSGNDYERRMREVKALLDGAVTREAQHDADFPPS